MLLREIRLQSLQLKTYFHALQSLSLISTLPHPEPLNDSVYYASTLVKKPNWQKNNRLKSIVSHMSPHSVSKILAFLSNDITLSLKFFKWVCKQSTYCYDTDSRFQLLNLLAYDNLYGILHKVLIFLIKESCDSEVVILKLMGAIEDLRGKFGFRMNYPCYSTLLMRLAKLDMGLMAFLVFKKMEEDEFVVGGIDYKTIINALCKNGFVRAAEMFFSKVLKLGFMLDVYVYTSLVLGNCRADDLTEAFRVFELMSKGDGFGVNGVTYSILVHGLCQAGKLDEACKLKEVMSEKGCQPDVCTYTVLIKAMCDKGLIKKAFNLVVEMIKKGCMPNVHTYTVMVDMLCIEGKIEEANGMFRKMLKEGLSPSTVTYNALINGYCKEGRVISAFELLGVMERRHCKPNICTYNELIEGLCKVNSPHKAVALLRKAINNGLFPTEVTFNILIDGFCRAGHLDMAFKILHSMITLGIEPDQFSYTPLINGFCNMEKLDQASAILGVMVRKEIPLDEVTLTALIHGYCNIGKNISALKLFERMVNGWCLTGPHMFNIFLDILSKATKLDEENALFGKMIKYGLVPTVVTYTILIDGLCRAGDTSSSLKMLESMTQAGCPPNVYTYNIVISGLCQCGKVEEAENLLVDMQKAALPPNDAIYALLVKSHVAAGRLNRAFEIVSTMIQNGCQPNPRIYFDLLIGIFNLEMTVSSRAGTLMAVINTESSNSGQIGVRTSSNLLFREIDIYHAIQLQYKVRECGGHLFGVCKFLILGLCSTGRISEADTLIQEMVNNGLTPDSDICACIIEHFCKIHNFDSCFEWIRRFLGYGCVPSFTSYCAVIIGLHNSENFQEAEWLISDLLRNAGVEDKTAISPYTDFLVKEEDPRQNFELLCLIEKMGYYKRPIV